MGDLNTLSLKFKKLTADLEKEVSRCAVEASLDIHFALVTSTPVDTTNALSNWQVSLDSPETQEIGPYAPGRHGSTRGESMGAAIAQGREALARKIPGQPIFIANRAPYIGDLESGTSRQAPSGFLQQAILVGRRKIKSFKIKLRF